MQFEKNEILSFLWAREEKKKLIKQNTIWKVSFLWYIGCFKKYLQPPITRYTELYWCCENSILVFGCKINWQEKKLQWAINFNFFPVFTFKLGMTLVHKEVELETKYEPHWFSFTGMKAVRSYIKGYFKHFCLTYSLLMWYSFLCLNNFIFATRE